MALSIQRADIEDFLYHEAALLDEWQMEEWLGLFAEGASYWVPPAGSDDDVDPATTLFYVADDWFRLQQRVKRLGKKTAHVEYPKSRCRHMISNVRVLDTSVSLGGPATAVGQSYGIDAGGSTELHAFCVEVS